METGRLKVLLLADNHLTTIRPLAKADLASLETLALSI